MSAASKQRLLDYPWPGNIRELANVIERTVVMHTAELIEPEHLNLDPYPSCALPVGKNSPGIGKEIHHRYVGGAERKSDESSRGPWDQRTRTLRNKLHEYQINLAS